MKAIVTAITGCRFEKIDPVSKDAVMMKILQVLAGTMHTGLLSCSMILLCARLLMLIFKLYSK
ncbi:hypothetical protein AHAS_Ahas06G0023000 [Arachis hypogaea]